MSAKKKSHGPVSKSDKRKKDKKARAAAALEKATKRAAKDRDKVEVERARRDWRPQPGRSKVWRRPVRTEWTETSAWNALVESCVMLRARAMKHLECWNLDQPTMLLFEEMFGYPGTTQNGLASNTATRMAVAVRWMHDALQMIEDHPARHFYMITFIDDAIRTSECDTEIRLTGFQKSVRNVLDYAGIDDWLGFTELQPYTNWRGGQGRDIAPHMHVLHWRSGSLSPQARHRLEKTKRFSSLTGAACVVVTERLATRGQVAHWAGYPLKLPERGTNLKVSANDPDKWVGYNSFVEPILAVRLMEILSQMSLKSLIHAGGDGRHYRDRMIETIDRRSMGKHGKWPLRPADSADIWARMRELAGKTNRPPVRFERD